MLILPFVRMLRLLESSCHVTLATLTPIDYGVLLLYLGAVVGVGAYFSGRQKDVGEFFFGSRSLGWFPLGFSLLATIVSPHVYTQLPGQAYEQGLRLWIVPAALWLVLPVAVYLVIPLFRGLGVESLYEYLEQRFDARVRLAVSLIFVAWRLWWLGVIVYAACQAISIAAGWNVPAWLLIVPLGAISTLYTFLGGLRAVVWTGVVQASAMLLGVFVLVVAVWLSVDGGPTRVAELAEGLGRLQPATMRFTWTDKWTLWGALPYWILTALGFTVADQITAQRWLSSKHVNAARNAYLASTLALSCLLPGLIYAGLCLFAFYYDHPHEMPPHWVVNLENKTRQPIVGPDGRPLLDPARPAHRLTWETIDRLVAERRVLQPNNKEPFTDAAELIDSETNRVRVERLAMRKTNVDNFRGEVVVARGAAEEMLPHFVATRLSWGAAGIVLVALLAAAMAAIDAGLNSLCTLLVVDFHRRFGVGRAWLARRRGKSTADLTEADELQLARPLTLVLGGGVMLIAAGAAFAGDRLPLVLSATNCLGAPLLAVFLLGMLTRRATATAALMATAAGLPFTIGLSVANKLAAAKVLPLPAFAMAEIWNLVGGVLFTVVLGYLLSLLLGKRKSYLDLRGLVAGCGTLGVRATEEAHPLITLPEEPAADTKWK